MQRAEFVVGLLGLNYYLVSWDPRMLCLLQTAPFQAILQHLLPGVVASISSMALKSPLSTLKTLVGLNFKQGKYVKVNRRKSEEQRMPCLTWPQQQ